MEISERFPIYWNNFSPQCRWKATDIYLAAWRRSTVNISRPAPLYSYSPPFRWTIVNYSIFRHIVCTRGSMLAFSLGFGNIKTIKLWNRTWITFRTQWKHRNKRWNITEQPVRINWRVGPYGKMSPLSVLTLVRSIINPVVLGYLFTCIIWEINWISLWSLYSFSTLTICRVCLVTLDKFETFLLNKKLQVNDNKN